MTQRILNAIVAFLLAIAVNVVQSRLGVTDENLRVVQQYLATTEGCR